MKTLNKVKMIWYYAILCGLSQILDGLSIIITLGHWSTNLSLKVAIIGARKSWCVVTPIEEEPTKKPIDYVGKIDRYRMDGDGDPLDDYGTGLGGQPLQNVKILHDNSQEPDDNFDVHIPLQTKKTLKGKLIINKNE